MESALSNECIVVHFWLSCDQNLIHMTNSTPGNWVYLENGMGWKHDSKTYTHRVKTALSNERITVQFQQSRDLFHTWKMGIS